MPGFAEADVVIEKEFKTAAVHQAYIEPHACVARCDADGQTEIWSLQPGPLPDARADRADPRHEDRRYARLCRRDRRRLRRQDRGLPGAGRDAAVAEVRPAGAADDEPRRSVQGHRPDLRFVDVGEDRRDQGRQAGRRRWHLQVPGRRVPRLAGDERLPVLVRAVRHPERARGRLRRGVQPAEVGRVSRAGLADRGVRGRKRAGHAGAQDRHGPAGTAAARTCARIGTPTIFGPKHAHDGYIETIEALQKHPAYKTPLGKNQGRGVASGYWFNGGGESSATLQVNADGTVLVATGSPDIGGSRASMAIMAAETLGVDYNQVRAIVADTGSVGYTHVTGGSRVTFATGMAVVNATKNVIEDLLQARRDDLGRRSRRRGLGRRLRQAGGQQRRRLQADVAEGDRRRRRRRPAVRSAPRRR